MPAQIERAVFCADYFADYEVAGSRGETYTVTLNGAESQPHCTCPAYKYAKGPIYDRTCKHITYVWDHACLWNPQWKDGGPDDIQPVAYHPGHTLLDDEHNRCPACGGPTVPVLIAV